MKKLALPGGGHFEIPLPKRGKFVPGTSLKGASYELGLSRGHKVAIVLGGAALGGLVAWALAEILD